MTLNVIEQTILRAFNAAMSMDKSATNIRRASREVAACKTISDMVHRENMKHLYDKRIHKGAGEYRMNDTKVVIEQGPDTSIKGPVTINIVATPKRRKAMEAA